jgi:hypothetical protein
MPNEDILGFINQFVEHDGYRVIVLANEEAKSIDRESGFATIKEKVIGRTFQIRPNAAGALNHFLEEVSARKAHNILTQKKDQVLAIFQRADYNNLRQLRQAVFDFSDIWDCVQTAELDQKMEFVDRLLNDVLTLSIEHRAGILSIADMTELGGRDWFKYFNVKEDTSENTPLPVAPISPAYSLLDKSYSKLRQIVDELKPSVIYAENQQAFASALAAIGRTSLSIEEFYWSPSEAVDRAFKDLSPDTVAKVLFTSGSTGTPKGVLNTQRMLTVNQLQSALVWPFLTDEPPVLVDWLPWNHTFGGNYTFNLVLCHGGTMYIDHGKPMPGAFDQTLKNLREVSPTIYFNVPRGFELLLPHLEEDAEFRKHFFAKCRFALYAGASLPLNVWKRLEKMGKEECSGQLVLASSWGSTETAPMCMGSHAGNTTLGTIGLPVPGCEIKLVPNAGKLEARVRGPNITRGYLNATAVGLNAFDEEGFYCMGDPEAIIDYSQSLDPAKRFVAKDYLHARANYQLETDNIMDLSHIEFLHPGSLGSDAVNQAATEVIQEGNTVFSNRLTQNERLHESLEQRYNIPEGQKVDRWLDVRWDPPANMELWVGNYYGEQQRVILDFSFCRTKTMRHGHAVNHQWTRRPGSQTRSKATGLDCQRSHLV